MGVRSHHPSVVATAVSEVLRTVSICAPVSLLDAPAALAQDVAPATLTADIPAQPLARALTAFASQTGLQLVYVSGIVRNQKSHAVRAGLSAQQALARLLQGTRLRFEYLTPHSIRILTAKAPPRTTTGTATGDEPYEVIVTANRREENLQDVPISIQVLTNATLARLNAVTFDDFVSYLPGVTAHGVGPGQNNIYVRGLATAEPGIQGSGFGGSFPNVALYLDEQSAQLPHRNLDLYATDLERIEILEGPQGTLFGAGAQAGVVRYITNKPQLNVTEAMVNAGYATTAHGGPSRALDAVINVPIVTDRLAVRGVIYNAKRGGYIDNTPATFARVSTDRSISYAQSAGQVPANSVVINNFDLVAKGINPVTYKGGRVAALYQFNADWNGLLTQSYQNMEADGVFAEMAVDSLGKPQPKLTVQLYNPSYNKDRFENTALTIEGRVGALKLLYTGAYLVRNVEPDILTNNELGWRTRWLDRRLQWDGAIYQEDWNHVQLGSFGIDVIGAGGNALNGGGYRVRGVETSAVARITTRLTIEAGAAWNHSELVREPSFVWADGTPIDFGALQTSTRQTLSNPAGGLGSPLAAAPPFQGNIRVRYEFALDGYDAFAQIGAVHQSHSLASTDWLTLDLQSHSIAYELPAFTTYDAGLGVGKDAWLLQVYGENLTDTRAELYANSSLGYKAITVNRPRTIGLRLSYKFNSS